MWNKTLLCAHVSHESVLHSIQRGRQKMQVNASYLIIV